MKTNYKICLYTSGKHREEKETITEIEAIEVLKFWLEKYAGSGVCVSIERINPYE